MAEVADLFLDSDEVLTPGEFDGDVSYFSHAEMVEYDAVDPFYETLDFDAPFSFSETRTSGDLNLNLSLPVEFVSGEGDGDGLRLTGLDSVSDIEMEAGSSDAAGSRSPPFWDCLEIDADAACGGGEEEDAGETGWEEVGGGGGGEDGFFEERDLLSMMVGVDSDREADDSGFSSEIDFVAAESPLRGEFLELNVEEEGDEDEFDMFHSVGWEVLPLPFGAADEGFEVLTAQLGDVAGPVGAPPAARAAVERLPSVVFGEKDVHACAVCKDAIVTGERATQLPCDHCYHGGCIRPWLAIRNTCPVCRHELPTDDPEYERWKTVQTARNSGSGDRYGHLA